MALIADTDLHNAVDIGCGTGEQTKTLSEKFLAYAFFGIGLSKKMLAGTGKQFSI